MTVTIDVTDVNEPPDAVADTGRAREDGAVTIDVLANDSDPEDDHSALTLRVTADPRRGRATVNEPANPGERPTITYTPRADYHGADSFTYEVRDAGSPSLASTATVSVEVDAVNDAPTFKSATTTRSVSKSATGGKVGAPVTATDVDNNDTLTYSLLGTEAHFLPSVLAAVRSPSATGSPSTSRPRTPTPSQSPPTTRTATEQPLR